MSLGKGVLIVWVLWIRAGIPEQSVLWQNRSSRRSGMRRIEEIRTEMKAWKELW